MTASRLDDATWVAGLLALSGPALGGALVEAEVGDSFLAAYAKATGSNGALRPVPASIPAEALTGTLDLAATLAMGRPVQTQGLLVPGAKTRLLVRRAANLATACTSLMARSLDCCELLLVAVAQLSDPDDAVAIKLVERLPFTVTGVAQEFWSKQDVHRAAELVGHIEFDMRFVDELCQAAHAIGIASPRAVLQTVAAAKGVAALQGLRQVDEASLAIAARLVLAHRATQFPDQPQPETQENNEEPPPPPDSADRESSPLPEPADAEVILEAIKPALPEGLLQFASVDGLGKRGAGRNVKSAAPAKSSGQRGRRVGHKRVSSLAGQKLDVIATLRNAAPWQALRQRFSGTDRMIVTRDDFRVHRIKKRNEATAIFAVDASGSTAFQRLAEAKGAVETILAECYVRRDRVALVAFKSKKAEQLLPPTRSLERARRALSALPGGGGTPLAAGLDEAFALAMNVRRTGGNPIVIVLTDGRANVTRSGEGNKVVALEETQAAAKLFALEGFDAMVIDVSPQPQQSAKALASAMHAAYLPMPHARATDIARPISAALKTASA